jgi:hypothetical protein
MGRFDTNPIIANRGEFVDALKLLCRGHVLVRVGEGACSCVLDGATVHHSFDTLLRYGLIQEFENRDGFAGAHYYRITERGREFADRAWAAWRNTRPLQRMMVRLVG